MLQSKARLLELNSKLAEILTSKGVSATADETTTSLVNKVDLTISNYSELIKYIVGCNAKELTLPDIITNIGNYAFYNYTSLENITLPDSVTTIGFYAFRLCANLQNITIPNSVTTIGNYVLSKCTSLRSITIPNSVTNIGNYVLSECTNIEDVTLGDGFNCNNLDVSASTKLERDTVVNMFNALYDRTGLSAYTITINKVVADKLTDDDKAIATTKNWIIAVKEV